MGKQKELYGHVTEKLICSDAWQRLTKNQIILYLFSLCCCHHADRPRRDFPVRLQDVPNCFYLSYETAKKYGVYHSAHPNFYVDRKRLIDLGFWEVVEMERPGGKRKRTVFKLSDKWQKG